MCSWGLSEWGDVANIVIAVASVATAIVTAIVLIKQRKDNIKEKQPRFTFSTQKGYLIIRGEQGKCLQIEGVDVNKCVEVWRPDKKMRKAIPLKNSSMVCLRQDDEGQYASLGVDLTQHVELIDKFNIGVIDIDSSLWNYREVELLCVKYIDIHMSCSEQYFVIAQLPLKKSIKNI